MHFRSSLLSLCFGGREVTTRNASALCRLPNWMQIYYHIKHDKSYVRMTTHFFCPQRLFFFFVVLFVISYHDVKLAAPRKTWYCERFYFQI